MLAGSRTCYLSNAQYQFRFELRLRIDESQISDQRCRALTGGHDIGAHALKSMILGCDHCRGELGRNAECYWRMRFCSTACMSEYQHRLSTETQLKILTLDDRRSGSRRLDDFGAGDL